MSKQDGNPQIIYIKNSKKEQACFKNSDWGKDPGEYLEQRG